MFQEIELSVKFNRKVSLDCFGCDYQKDEYTTKKKWHGLVKQTYVKYVCSKLGIQLSSKLMDLWGMTPEQCPCHFQHWQQTNEDLEVDNLFAFKFSFEDNKVIVKELPNQNES